MAQRGRGRTGPPVSLWSKLSGVLTQQPIISHVTDYSCRHLSLEEGRSFENVYSHQPTSLIREQWRTNNQPCHVTVLSLVLCGSILYR